MVAALNEVDVVNGSGVVRVSASVVSGGGGGVLMLVLGGGGGSVEERRVFSLFGFCVDISSVTELLCLSECVCADVDDGCGRDVFSVCDCVYSSSLSFSRCAVTTGDGGAGSR